MRNAVTPELAESITSTFAAEPLFDTYANKLFPNNLHDALLWAVWLRQRHGDFTAAIARAVSYFLNGLELTGDLDEAESRDRYQQELLRKHKILHHVLDVGLDLQFYGNSFTTAMLPILRSIRCPKCYTSRYLKSLKRGRDYDFKNGAFISKCVCGYSGEFVIKDYVDSAATTPLTLVHWNPLNINMDYCAITGAKRITYNPSKYDKEFLDDEQAAVALETLPKRLLDAIVHDASLTLSGSACLHLAAQTDAINGQSMHGWGLPKFMTAFKHIIMLMLLDRQTEASVKDFILPIRLLFPDPGTNKSGADPVSGNMHSVHLNKLKAIVEKSLASQSLHQASWHMIPTAVQQLSLGGDGKALVPVELLQYEKDQLLDALCVPQEFYKAAIMSVQADSMNLRMFEQTWERDVESLDDWVAWYLQQCSQFLGWPSLDGCLMRQSISNDPARMNFMMQLYSEGKISFTSISRMMRIDAKQERSLIIEDQLRDAKLQQEISDRLQKAGFISQMANMPTQQAMDQAMMNAQGQGDPNAQGGAPQGGAPAPAGAPAQPGMGGAPVMGPQTGDPMTDIQNLMSVKAPAGISAEQVQADAQVVAQILMQTPIGTQRNQIYNMVKQLNPTLYNIAKSILQTLENQAKQRGVEAARQGQL